MGRGGGFDPDGAEYSREDARWRSKRRCAPSRRARGIQAAKRAGELIPLCHVLPAVSVGVEVTPDSELPGLRVRAVARVQGSTGVEMEALAAVSVALLTLYDMGKAIDREMTISDIRLTEKAGGRSGVWKAENG